MKERKTNQRKNELKKKLKTLQRKKKIIRERKMNQRKKEKSFKNHFKKII